MLCLSAGVTVKGYAEHEAKTLERVTEARRDAGKVDGVEAQAKAEAGLAKQVRQLFAVVENYPELKASDNFIQLHRSLVEIEDALQNARRYYNAVVRDLNTRVQSFPDLIVASLFRFETRDFFELDSETERLAPQVDLGG